MRGFAVVVLMAAPVFAQRLESISPMNEPRAVYTATVLRDGRVLIAGGGNGFGVMARMEIYDPVARRFSRAGEMLSPRTEHAATLLPDGRVLMTGGEIGRPAVDFSEICDPLAQTCVSAGRPHFEHRSHVAVLVSPTKVLLWGGWRSSAELYDITSDSYTVIEPPVSEWEYNMSVTPLGDGRVIAIGGVHGDAPTARVRLFDPATESIRELPPISMPRAAHAAALLPDGTILVVGGFIKPVPVSVETCSAEIYDSRTGLSHSTAAISSPCWAPQATPMADGRVLVTQYVDVPLHGIPHAVVELFDPPRAAFLPVSGAEAIRVSSQKTLLRDGTVLITGGGFAGLDAMLFFPDIARRRSVAYIHR